jgi:hypothetical protein
MLENFSIKERLRTFLMKVLSVRFLVILPITTLLLAKGLVSEWIWLAIVVSIISFKSFEKMLEKWRA